MITVQWISNFCNNMFQWAVLYAVSRKTGIPYTTNGWTGEATRRAYKVADGREIFNLPPEPDFSLYQETGRFMDSNSMDQSFNPEIFNIPDGTKLWGYFQTDKYFRDYRNDILKYFTYKDPKYDKRAKELIDSMNRKIVVCAHSREGDYVTDPGFTVVSELYFRKAFELLFKKLNIKAEDIGCIFTSDNKDSTKLNFLNELGVKLLISKEDNFTDMSIMKQADHCITANSTFSWWGAWLNQKQPIIISPFKWINFDFDDRDFSSPRHIQMSLLNQYFIDNKGNLQ